MKPGITELYQQEEQDHRQAMRLLRTPRMWVQRQERWRGRHPWESRQLGIPAPRVRCLLSHPLMPHRPLCRLRAVGLQQGSTLPTQEAVVSHPPTSPTTTHPREASERAHSRLRSKINF